jgi:hypothetical protein
VSPDPAPAKSVSQETTFFMTWLMRQRCEKRLYSNPNRSDSGCGKWICAEIRFAEVRWENFVTISRQVIVGQKVVRIQWSMNWLKNCFRDLDSWSGRFADRSGSIWNRDEAEQLSFFILPLKKRIGCCRQSIRSE